MWACGWGQAICGKCFLRAFSLFPPFPLFPPFLLAPGTGPQVSVYRDLSSFSVHDNAEMPVQPKYIMYGNPLASILASIN